MDSGIPRQQLSSVPLAGSGLPQRTKTIYFFGAGASAAESPVAPTNQNLLSGGLMHRRQHYKTLQRFLAAWGFSDTTFLPSIEELLSILDMCLARGEPIGQRWSVSDLTRCREELVTCIYEFIAETLVDVNAEDHGLYQAMLSRVIHPDVSLISLNYDLLLDNALARMGRAPVYGIDFVEDHVPLSGDPVKLFKLHGSLNWGYCPSCFATIRLSNRKLPENQRCTTCGGVMTALIVPPTPIKVPPSPFLSALWKKAEWELAQAKRIVFVGYSLSEADANIRYLLFRGFFGHTPHVTVVLKHDHPDHDVLAIGRYNRLFPGGVEFYWGGFEAYVQEGCGEGAQRSAPGPNINLGAE